MKNVLIINDSDFSNNYVSRITYDTSVLNLEGKMIGGNYNGTETFIIEHDFESDFTIQRISVFCQRGNNGQTYTHKLRRYNKTTFELTGESSFSFVYQNDQTVIAELDTELTIHTNEYVGYFANSSPYVVHGSYEIESETNKDLLLFNYDGTWEHNRVAAYKYTHYNILYGYYV